MRRYISYVLIIIWVNNCLCVSHNQNAMTPTPKEEKYCKQEGLLCKDCTKLIECVKDDNGFKEIPVKECNTSKSEYCFNNRKCSKNFNTHCTPNYEFNCTATAFFPDPVDCRMFHTCVEVDENVFRHNVFTCDEPYSYNQFTTHCDNELVGNRCPDNLPVPQCDYVGQTGPLENKVIWFICLDRMIPELHLCPNDQFYNGTACEQYIWP